jgi:hypothetical protein
VYNQVVEKVMEIMYWDFKPDQVPKKILDQAIAEVRAQTPGRYASGRHLREG